MFSNFGSLNIALRTLQTMQLALNVTSQNVANASTESYSRQKAVLVATDPYSVPADNRYQTFGQIGTGVKVSVIQRYRADEIDDQMRSVTSKVESWNTRGKTLGQIEVMFNEPSDTGLSATMDDFWSAWVDLSNSPDSTAARTNLVQTASNLTDMIKDTYNQLTLLRKELDTQVRDQVTSINDLATQIASLNEKIRAVTAVGQQPNDLLDQRTDLLSKLSEIVNVDVKESENGSAMVSLGGRLLVMDSTASKLAVEPDSSNSMLNKVVWEDSGAAVNISGVSLEGGLTDEAAEKVYGQLGGTLISRDQMITNYLDQLDTIANAIITSVNDIHRTGYGKEGSHGYDFFSGNSALTMAVSDDIMADFNRIASAAADGSDGDGSIALKISHLQNEEVLNGNTTTIGDFYNAVISGLGQSTAQTETMSSNYELLIEHLKSQQAQMSGVSVDEESVNLIQYQRTYQAAARVMTTLDEMLDRVINGMGRVGL